MAATPIPSNQAAFSASEIAEVTGADVVAAPSQRGVGVSTDSRTTVAGNLFVALSGPTHDGHDHVRAALEKGARAVLVERDVDVPEGVGVFRVDDTLSALGALAGFHRRRYDVPVVAITGSVGKTSTKELVAAALTGLGHHLVYTHGNLNNRIGVPMTLFTLGPEHDAAVIEVGMNVPGEIEDLTAITAPTVGIVTAVGEVHTEGVGGLSGVAREKASLLMGLSADATAIWRMEAPLLDALAPRSPAGRKLTYGLGEDAEVRLIRYELDGHGGTEASYRLPSREQALDVRLQSLGEAAAVNAAAALAVIEALEPARLEDAARALAEVPPHPGRMVPRELPSGLLLIDDTYNASPPSTRAALETASALANARDGKLVAVLGDMLELGHDAERLHEDIGREAARVGAGALIACGELMSHAGRAALKATMESSARPRMKVILIKKVEDAADLVRELAAPHDVVLVKGSRGMRMERVVEALTPEGAR